MPHLSWPNAIIHCDADAFYVGCEISRHPELRGKPVVVTGKLGGIVLAKSYDLKARGVKTGQPIWEIKKQHSDIIVLNTDFEFYNDLSAKMFAILRQWSPDVEVYSVDEAFIDIKGFRRLYKKDYGQIAYAIKEQIKQQLGITVSVGVSTSKTLAKMAAEVNKPDGVTVISAKQIQEWLPKFHVSDVPGFGRNTVPLLEKFGIHTCADFVNLTQDTVKSILHRPGVDLWRELQGEQVHSVENSFAPNKIITRTSSFEPITTNQKFLWAHTIRQLERAIEALHYDHQLTREISLYLRDKAFNRYDWKYELSVPTKSFSILLDALKKIWREHFPTGALIRSSGVTLSRLSFNAGLQLTLFEDPGLIIRKDELEKSKHHIKEKFGNLAIRSASSLRLKQRLGPNKKNPLKTKAFNVEW
ncbi:MAG: DNA polymerase IV [bacterium]|nr:DNA polymerase IV [bacterium]